MGTRRKNSISLTVQVSLEEKQILEKFCQKLGRSQTDVIRELIRKLEQE
jgi:predicted DNA-binding protein